MTAAPRCCRIISSDGRSRTRDAQPPGHNGPSGQASPAMVVQRTAFSTAGTECIDIRRSESLRKNPLRSYATYRIAVKSRWRR
jgi:hypothetical protein